MAINTIHDITTSYSCFRFLCYTALQIADLWANNLKLALPVTITLMVCILWELVHRACKPTHTIFITACSCQSDCWCHSQRCQGREARGNTQPNQLRSLAKSTIEMHQSVCFMALLIKPCSNISGEAIKGFPLPFHLMKGSTPLTPNAS